MNRSSGCCVLCGREVQPRTLRIDRSLVEDLLTSDSYGEILTTDAFGEASARGLEDHDDIRDLALGLISRMLIHGLLKATLYRGAGAEVPYASTAEAIHHIVDLWGWSECPAPMTTGEIVLLSKTSKGELLERQLMRREGWLNSCTHPGAARLAEVRDYLDQLSLPATRQARLAVASIFDLRDLTGLPYAHARLLASGHQRLLPTGVQSDLADLSAQLTSMDSDPTCWSADEVAVSPVWTAVRQSAAGLLGRWPVTCSCCACEELATAPAHWRPADVDLTGLWEPAVLPFAQLLHALSTGRILEKEFLFRWHRTPLTDMCPANKAVVAAFGTLGNLRERAIASLSQLSAIADDAGRFVGEAPACRARIAH